MDWLAPDLDWLVPHQANIRIIQATANTLGLPRDKIVTTLETRANTSAASVPLALDAPSRRTHTARHLCCWRRSAPA